MREMRLNNRACTYVPVLLLLFVSVQLSAQQGTYAGITVELSVTATDGEQIVADIVEGAVSIYLGNLGFVVSIIDSADEPNSDATTVDADFAVIGTTSVDGDYVLIGLELLDLMTNERIGSVSETAKIDLRLDVLIGGVVEGLIDDGADRIASVADAKGTAVTTESTIDGSDSTDTGGATSGDGSTTGGTITGVGLPPGRPIVSPGPQPAVFETSIGFSPMFSTGDASRYFDISYGGEFYADLVITTPTGYLGVGLAAGGSYIQAEGLSLSADYIVVPFGLDLRFSSDPRPIGMFVGISGGGAVMTAYTEAFGRFTKIVPYAAARTGATLAFAPGFGLSIGITYSAYFEGSIILMGFSPSVNVFLRL